ncbi:MAG: ABC transporter substrate-binding protein [Alphaproteobacteria bacterium]|nr:ABC transporter substrate-binding protein [Alphaproteobacteria bacterium]
MRRLARALAALLLVLGAAPAAAQGILNLYCSAPVEWCQVMANGFQAASGIHVAMTQKSTGEVLAQMRAEAANPKGDLWWTGQADAHLVAAEDGLTQEYRPAALDDLEPWARQQWTVSHGRAVGVAGLAVGIGFNTEILAKRRLAAPRCWADLLRPAYRDEIQMSNPNSSGTAYTVIGILVQAMGEDGAFSYLQALHANVNSYPRSGVAPTRAVARGETGISIGFLQGFAAEKQAGFPVETVAPCEGTALAVDSMSIVRGARNIAAARRFFDWALSPEAQALTAKAGQLHLPANRKAPPPPGTPDLATAKLLDYDFARFGRGAERARLLARWDAEVGSRPR